MSHGPLREVGMDEGSDYAAAFRILNRMVDDGKSWSGHERNCCFLNTARPRFADVSAVSGLNFADDARAIASVDWDHDGDLDVIQVNRTAPQLRFMQNNWNADANWVSFRLVGRTCNRDAIGARVRVVRRGLDGHDVRTLRAGSAFLSQSSKSIHFGLGSNSRVERVEVSWPGGEVETFQDIKPNRRYRLVQGSGVSVALPPRSSVTRLASSVVDVPAETESAQVLLSARLPLPPLQFHSLDGESQNLHVREKGHATLVQLWASWCPMCAAEMGEFSTAADRIRAAKLNVVALSVDGLGRDESTQQNAIRALQNRPYPFQTGFATQTLLGQLEVLRAELFSNSRPFPVPTCFLIDSRNQLAAVYVGPVSIDRILDDVQQLESTPEELRVAAMPFAGRWLSEPKSIRLAPIAKSMRFANQTDIADWYQRRAAPQSAISHCGLALSAERRGDTAQARAHYKEALTLAPRVAEVQNYVGEFLMRQRDVASALERFRTATDLVNRADDQSSAEVASRSYYNLGALSMAAGRVTEALDSLQRCLEFLPDHALAHTAIAKILQGQQQWDDAQRHLEAALRIDPLLIPAHVYLGRVFVHQRQLDLAAREFSKAVELDDRVVDAHANLASVLATQGKTEDAIRHFRRALQLRPAAQHVALQLAWCLATSPESQLRSGNESVELATHAVKSAKGKPSAFALDVLAAAHAEAGNFAEALQTLDRAELLAEGQANWLQRLRRHRALYEKRQPLRVRVNP